MIVSQKSSRPHWGKLPTRNIALKQGHETSYNEMATDNTKMGHGLLYSVKRETTVFEIQTREGPGSSPWPRLHV